MLHVLLDCGLPTDVSTESVNRLETCLVTLSAVNFPVSAVRFVCAILPDFLCLLWLSALSRPLYRACDTLLTPQLVVLQIRSRLLRAPATAVTLTRELSSTPTGRTKFR